LKVLHIIDSGGLYGAEVMLLELIIEQRKQGIDAQLCSIGSNNCEKKEIEIKANFEKIPLYVVRMGSGFSASGANKIVKYAHRHDFDIMHSHGYKPSILLALLPGFIRRMPTVRTLHGWTSANKLSKIYFYEYLDVLLLRRSTAVVAVNKSIFKKKNIDYKKNIKFSVVENGISKKAPLIDNDETIVKKILNIKGDDYLICSIGRLSYEKGFDILLRAFSELKKNDESYKLIIFGEGELEENLFKLAKDLDISDKVCFFGYHDNASKYLPLMDVYVNSSRSEGMPITLLEAMRSGCPIVATNVGGVSEMLNNGEYGVLADSENIDQIVEGIKKSKDMSSDDKKGLQLFFKNNFISEMMANKYFDIYEWIQDKY